MFGWKGVRRVGKRTKGGRKGQRKKKTQKLGVIECQCYHHLRRAHNVIVNDGRGVEQQDGCRSDVEDHEVEKREELQSATLLFLFMYVRKIRPVNHAAGCIPFINNYTHAFTHSHTHKD